jgi:hypothetical protein
MSPKKYQLSIHTIFLPRENLFFLKEWLFYHFNLGVEHIYLYDNTGSMGRESSTGTVNKYGINFQCHPDDTRLIPSISPSESEIHIIDDMDHMLRLQQGEPTLLSYADAGTKPMVRDVKDLVCSWVKVQKANRALKL